MLLVAVVSVLGSAIAYSIVSGGLSAHDEPSRVEEVLARAMRRWATPRRCVTEPIPCSRRQKSSIKRWATTQTTARPATPTTEAATRRLVEACT